MLDDDTLHCGYCDRKFHVGCKEGCDENLVFWYYDDCQDLLDERDPAMNLKLQELLVDIKAEEELKREYGVHSLDNLCEVAK